jgi:hypothetical protein
MLLLMRLTRHRRVPIRCARMLALTLLVADVASCSSSTESPDLGQRLDGSGSTRPDTARDTTVALDRRVDQRAVQATPELFTGRWRFVEMTCEGGDQISFVGYSYTLELQPTRGTAIDASSGCTLTTKDFPVVKTAEGYELVYTSAASLICDPSPCTLTITSKMGNDTKQNVYQCPKDFPLDGPREVIIAADATTLTSGYHDMPCLNRYQRLNP